MDKNDQDNKERGKIVFFCKDCEEIVDTNRVGRKYVYTCKKCRTKNVAFGTEKSIATFFRLDEKEEKKGKDKKKKSEKEGEEKKK